MEYTLFLLATAAEEVKGFGLNPNLLETNLFNIVIFVGGLVYLGRDVVGKILTERRQGIETAIAEAEKRKEAAMVQLAEEQQKLAQAQATCEALRKKAESDAMAAREAILATTQGEIDRVKAAAQLEIASEQERVQLILRQEVVEKALGEVRAYLAQGLNEVQQQHIIDRSLERLGASS